MKKVLSLFLVWVMVLTLIPLGAVTASAETRSGTTGDCIWTLVDGVLTISGNGEMGDYCDDDYYEFNERLDPDVTRERPWGSNDIVERIVILDGVLDIGELIFFGCNNLKTVEIADTVEIIHKGAFYACDNLKTIYLGSGIKEIHSMAFMTAYLTEDYNITDIYYNGTILEKENIVIHSSNFYETETWHFITDGDLRKGTDGNWYYYENGQKNQRTTLVKYKGKWFYIENGVWNKKAETLVKYENKWFYVKNGKWDKIANILFAYKGKGFYIKNGKWVKETTLVKHNGVYSYVENGKWKKTTTLCKYKNKLFYIKNGKWKKDTLLFAYNNEIYYIEKGKVKSDYSGEVNLKIQIKNGKVI